MKKITKHIIIILASFFPIIDSFTLHVYPTGRHFYSYFADAKLKFT